ncbi:MAG: hypothetical protein RR831_19320, partial [Stenotrophomonas sp.]
DVLSSDVENGAMLIEDPQTAMPKTIPIIISATSEGRTGTVAMTVKLNAGAFAKADSIRAEMCKMLTQVKPGKAGEQLAASTPKASTVNISASDFGF